MPNITPVDRFSRDPDDADLGRMSFFDHLAELRKRIINSLMAIALCSVVGIIISKRLIRFITAPMTRALAANNLNPSLYIRDAIGAVGLWINVGLYVGLAIAMPFVLYQVWLFVAPGLYKHERRAITAFIFFGTLLFLVGASFAYFVMLPEMLNFLIHFTVGMSIQPLIDIDEYLKLILVVMAGFGAMFEMPVIVYVLSLFGILTPKFLLKNFNYAMLVITIAAAALCPTPDATTMIMFMVLMVALYFVSVAVSWFVVRGKRAKEAAEAAASS
jgi:sec-independent protein translocase protein TatC